MIVVKIADLEPATHGHNLHVKVLKVDVVFDKPRPDGSRFIINEALVADSTGSILLTMRNGTVHCSVYQYSFVCL